MKLYLLYYFYIKIISISRLFNEFYKNNIYNPKSIEFIIKKS